MARATSLLKAFNEHAIPPDGAIIISSRFDSASIYSIYEITAFSDVENTERTAAGIELRAKARRIHVLVEPAGFGEGSVEPSMRSEGRSIPRRFADLHTLPGKRGERILISREPLDVPSPFTVGHAGGDNFAFIFFRTDDLYPALRKFMADVLYNDSGLDRDDAIEAAKIMMGTVGRLATWEHGGTGNA